MGKSMNKQVEKIRVFVEKGLEVEKQLIDLAQRLGNKREHVGPFMQKASVYEEILSFIDSLQEESQRMVSAEAKEAGYSPALEEVEKEVDNFLDQYTYPREEVDFYKFARHFINWQERKDTSMLEDAYDNGYKTGKGEINSQLPRWKKTIHDNGCWSCEIGVDPTKRLFEYEHYTINADELFKLLDKEG